MPKPKLASMIPVGAQHPMDLFEIGSEVVASHLEKGHADMFRPIPLGLTSLDEKLGGGCHGGDLVVLGGAQNVGKTALVMQAAGHAARFGGALVIIVCFEHSKMALWERLLIQESFNVGGQHATADHLRKAYLEVIHEREESKNLKSFEYLNRMVSKIPNGPAAWARLSQIQGNVWIVTGDSRQTSIDVLQSYVQMAKEYNDRILLVVDYIQRVPVFDGARALTPEERIEVVTQGLKALSLRATDDGLVVPVIGVAAADADGLRGGRVHMENLWGSSIVQYEPDVGIIMNKEGLGPDGFPIIRLAIEKSRHGPSDLEFRHKYFGSAYTFERNGTLVSESESWQAERKMLREEKYSHKQDDSIQESVMLQGK